MQMRMRTGSVRCPDANATGARMDRLRSRHARGTWKTVAAHLSCDPVLILSHTTRESGCCSFQSVPR